nr:DNA helicase [Tanacetum cinerariifolium]
MELVLSAGNPVGIDGIAKLDGGGGSYKRLKGVAWWWQKWQKVGQLEALELDKTNTLSTMKEQDVQSMKQYDVDQFGDSSIRQNTVAPQQGADTGGGNVMTHLFARRADLVDATTVHVSRIFDRLRHMCLDTRGSDCVNNSGNSYWQILHQNESAQRTDMQLVSHTRVHVSEIVSLHTLKDGSKTAVNQRLTFSSRTTSDSRARLVANSKDSLANPSVTTPPAEDVSYIDLGNYDQKGRYCGCLFWYAERLKGANHFMKHIRAYNQMFVMTSFGAKVDDSINKGRGPYVFKVSRIQNFRGRHQHTLNPQIVEGLYPLLFVFGQPGFYPKMVLKPKDGSGHGNKVSMNAYYKYHLHPLAKDFGLIFRCGRLFQQYVVTVFCAIEQYRLDWVRKNKKELRSDYLLGLYDVVSRGDREGIQAGSMVMLPRTFIGGPQYMYNHYLDALAICRSLGNPQVFEQKVNEFIRFLKLKKPFGYMIAFLYTIEFQKRGLPHSHTLLWVSLRSKITDACQIDDYISTKIPDLAYDPTGYKVVTELMMHGPCGVANPDAACTENRTEIHFMKGESRLDNCNVVPYNQKLSLAFHAHINVECCGWSMLIKYLFKYISKGPDRILAKVSKPIGDTSTSTDKQLMEVDEIKNHVDRRFRVSFHNRDRIDIIVNMPEKKKTTLIECSGDLFYFRMLLCYKKGCKSPDEVRTINGQLLPTYRAACEALGLLGDDKEWDVVLEESTVSATFVELRMLFAQILVYCDVADPIKLWTKHWCAMQDDIPSKVSDATGIPDYHDFGLPLPPRDMLEDLKNKLLMEERNYRRDLLSQYVVELVPKLNRDQKEVFTLITTTFEEGRQELLFVYGHGGTGKSFLWKTTISLERSQGKIVMAVASSGIASLLLPVGRTTHSRFKLPLDLTDESVCHAKKHSQLGDLLIAIDLIIWDEAPMNDRRCFEVLDRTLRDLMSAPEIVFGGKMIILGVYMLRENMRLLRSDLSDEQRKRSEVFAKWLLDVGNGEIGDNDQQDDEETSEVTVSQEYCIDAGKEGLSKLINFIYDDATLKAPTTSTLQEKAIVCPKNDTTDEVNAKILSSMKGVMKTYLSRDEAIPLGKQTSETGMLYPMEYLNTLTVPGFSPPELQLKVGTSIMMLLNVNLSGGLCNDTWMIVTSLMSLVRMSETTIAALKVGQENSILEAKVYRKWMSKTIPDMKPIGFCCILIDRKNNAVQANIDLKNIDYFNPLLKPNTAYRISNFFCEATTSYQQTLENAISLRFGKIANFVVLPQRESEFPEHHFEFTAYNQLQSRLPYPDENNKIIYPILTDYLGCIRSMSDVVPSGDATSAQKYRRLIHIENLKVCDLHVRLWSQMLIPTEVGATHHAASAPKLQPNKTEFMFVKITGIKIRRPTRIPPSDKLPAASALTLDQPGKKDEVPDTQLATSSSPTIEKSGRTPPTDVIEIVAKTIISTIPHRPFKLHATKENSSAAGTPNEPKAPTGKRSLDMDLSPEAKKERTLERL